MPIGPDPHRPVVFVVDDESCVTDTLAEILNREGYDAIAAYCAEDALDISLDRRPQLLITDVMLPGMNGIDLAIKMRRIFPDCKIVLFSGSARTADLLASANQQGHEFDLLLKPIHPSDLLARISDGLKPGDLSAAQAD